MKKFKKIRFHFIGDYYLKFELCSPYYGKGCKDHWHSDRLVAVLLHVWKLYVSIRVRTDRRLRAKYFNRLFKIFAMVSGDYAYKNTDPVKSHAYHISDHLFLLNGDEWRLTDNHQVFFNVTLNKYLGGSDRGKTYFGIGDALFDIDKDKEDVSIYYENKDYRKKFIRTLKRYHRKDDVCRFSDTANDGIKYIVPYRCRGSKKITTLDEAFTAAANYSDYMY